MIKTFLLTGLLVEDNLPELANLLWKVEARWDQLGLQLGIPKATLNVIKRDHQTTQEQFTEMLSVWLNGSHRPMKKVLVAALQSNVLQENRLADKVEEWTPSSIRLQGKL